MTDIAKFDFVLAIMVYKMNRRNNGRQFRVTGSCPCKKNIRNVKKHVCNNRVENDTAVLGINNENNLKKMQYFVTFVHPNYYCLFPPELLPLFFIRIHRSCYSFPTALRNCHSVQLIITVHINYLPFHPLFL